MPVRWQRIEPRVKAGYTLLEIMVACAVVAVLLAIAVPATTRVSEYSARTKSLSNLRQIGVAAHLYANDHNQNLPGQPTGDRQPDGSLPPQWPALFCAYLSPSNPATFIDPKDAAARKLTITDILSDARNNTGYIYNGFDEFAINGRPPSQIALNRLADQPNVVLLAQKKSGATAFFVSPLFQPVANLLDLLNPGAYEGGAHYLFVDGSVRYVKWDDYSNTFWLVNKAGSLPLPPLPPLPNGEPPSDERATAPGYRLVVSP